MTPDHRDPKVPSREREDTPGRIPAKQPDLDRPSRSTWEPDAPFSEPPGINPPQPWPEDSDE